MTRFRRNHPVAKALRDQRELQGVPNVEYIDHAEIGDDVLVVKYTTPPTVIGKGNHGTVRVVINTRLAVYVRGHAAAGVVVRSDFEDRTPVQSIHVGSIYPGPS
jgi:hypothetical protein